MNHEQFIETIEDLVPQPEELEFDRIGLIRPCTAEIKSVGICVDLTDYVMQEAARQGVDFLVVHHGHGQEVRQKIETLGIGAYGSHLALDTMDGGLIDRFATLFRLDNVVPITFEYKGKSVPKGAVIGNPEGYKVEIEVPVLSDIFPFVIEGFKKRIEKLASCGYIFDRLLTSYPHHYGQFNLPTFHYINPHREFYKVVVSTGPSIRSDFLEQVSPYHPDMFIAGSVKNGAAEYARQLGISIVTVGDFESHYHGMEKFAEVLFEKIKSAQPDGRGSVSVRFIPNYPMS